MKSPDALEDRLRRALDELAMSTPLANPHRPWNAEHPSSASSLEPELSHPDDSDDEGAPPRRPPWMDMKVLAVAACVVVLVAAVVAVGLHHEGTKIHKGVTSSSSTTTAPPTTVPVPATTTTTTTTAPAPPVGYTSALAAWDAGTRVPSYQQSSYWLQAASDLASAVSSGNPDTAGYSTAIGELRQLASVGGGAGLDPTQAAEFAADATALNKFFGTSGAYGSAY